MKTHRRSNPIFRSIIILNLVFIPALKTFTGGYARELSSTNQINLITPEDLLDYQAENRSRALSDPNDPAEISERTDRHPEGLDSRVDQPNAPPTLKVGSGCTYATIGAAIGAASAGDIIDIAGGVTFAEHLTINIDDLTLRGGYNGCGGSIAKTTVDGTSTGRVIQINGAIDVVLENLNIINGNHSWGAGIWMDVNSSLNGDNLDIFDNTATSYGGGLRVIGADVTLTNSFIRDNDAPKGAGVYATKSGTTEPWLILNQNADIKDNQALTGDGLGGGVFISEGTLGLSNDSDIDSNDAIDGGGVYLVTSTLNILGNTTAVNGNDASSDGGGIYAQGSTVNLDNVASITSNNAGTGGLGYGGGAYLDNSDIFGDSGLILLNNANNGGGGVFAANGSKVDMDLGTYTCLMAKCSQFSYNQATYQDGGGIYASYSTVDLRQTFMEENTADHAGGIFAYHSSVILDNTLLAENYEYGTGDEGDAIVLFSSDLDGNHATLAHNYSGTGSTAIFFDGTGSTMTLERSIIWGHTTSISEAGHSVTCSDIQGGYPGTDNRDENPLFVDLGSSDFHLQNTSPIIDRCMGGLSDDIDDENRPVTYYRSGTPYDMGSDEVGGRVGINSKGCAFGRIQDAVNAAGSGDTIEVSADTYNELVAINSKDLVIAGNYNDTCTAVGGGTTKVDGTGMSGSIFLITAGQVTLQDLTIENGSGSNQGGGVELLTGAQVTLDNTIVQHNSANYGGGVFVESGTVMTTTNGTQIYSNTAIVLGGGARVIGNFSGGPGTSINSNKAPSGGGLAITTGSATLTGLNNYVLQNVSSSTDGKGGGVYVSGNGIINLNAYVQIRQNTAAEGGGIYASEASIIINHAGVSGNVVTQFGGGFFLKDKSVLTGTQTYLGNTTNGNQAHLFGGGIFVENSTVDLTSSNIYGNFAETGGGGIYGDNADIQLGDVNIGGTESGQANWLGTSGQSGAGVYLTNGTEAIMNNTSIRANVFSSTLFVEGGGVYINGGSTLLMENNSDVSYHDLSSSGSTGAGIYATGNVTVTLDDSQVFYNTAVLYGGGIYSNGSNLIVQNGSSIHHNLATTHNGGGIDSEGSGKIYITDSSLEYNAAGSNGGGVNFNSGYMDAVNSIFHHNQAVGDGGGIANSGFLNITSDYGSCNPHAGPCSLFSENEANLGDETGTNTGGAIYNSLNLTVKHTVFISNTAEFGGAIYQSNTSASGTVENSLFYDNSTSASSGAAVRVFDGNFEAKHLTLANNTSAPAFSASASSSVDVFNSIAYLNPSGGFDGSGFNSYSCNLDQSFTVGPVADPLFVDASSDDYHLLSSSPAIDVCSTGLPIDLDGVSRPLNISYDMGVFEYLVHIFLPLILR